MFSSMSSLPVVDWVRPSGFPDVQGAARFTIEEIETLMIDGQLDGRAPLEGSSEWDPHRHERPLVVGK
jgi:hypothetical protein